MVSRHHAANDTIHRALVSGGVPAILEPVGVCREDVKRPDGMSLIPWEGGCPLLWDFTYCDSITPSNLSSAASGCGVLACATEEQKYCRYASSYIFIPMCIETRGAWVESARNLIHKIGAQLHF